MENKEIKTLSGYTVFIRPFFTYDQYIEIQKIWTRDVFYDAELKGVDGNPKPTGKMPANVIYEANRLAVSFLIVKILDPSGKEVQRQSNELPIPPADGTEVMDVVNRLSKEAAAAFDKKKAKA